MKTAKTTGTRTAENVFSESLKKAESAYVALLEPLSERGRLLDKYRKTAEAAKAEATTTSEEWRAALRASGGDIVKPVREIKQREIAARETAEEFDVLVSELEPIFRDLQTTTAQARELYLTAFYREDRSKLNAKLDALAQEVFSTEQGKQMLNLLAYQTRQVETDCRNDTWIQEIVRAAPQSVGIPVDEMESELTRTRAQNFIYDFIKRHWSSLGNTDDVAFCSTPLPPSPYELTNVTASPFAAREAVARLKSSGVIQ